MDEKVVLLAEKCFPLSGRVQEICKLAKEYKELRQDAFLGIISAGRRITEIDERLEELGV